MRGHARNATWDVAAQRRYRMRKHPEITHRQIIIVTPVPDMVESLST